jgi:hypothetical protein
MFKPLQPYTNIIICLNKYHRTKECDPSIAKVQKCACRIRFGLLLGQIPSEMEEVNGARSDTVLVNL